jgi:hypothetical protein
MNAESDPRDPRESSEPSGIRRLPHGEISHSNFPLDNPFCLLSDGDCELPPLSGTAADDPP